MKPLFPGLMLFLPVAFPAAAQGLRDPAALLASADADHDGRISRSEFQAARLAQFDRFDRNGDGVISRADFGRIVSMRPQAGARIDALIAEADLDHDSKVTRDELAHAPARIFDEADINHDGFVDQTELEAARARLRTMRGQ
ncbi:EF-hand domain-containing protein [Sphingomonas sp.]|uniref:EF-hand domain-containing protein n=1 Tax=Sphingomonas sp. TaxID=28214 RepID=UPI0025F09AE8|nr:EF-hand domain-containing protein [Sphingomonas sp.]